MAAVFIAERARTKAQQVRMCALRNPFELIKHRAYAASHGSKVQLEWVMPTQKVLEDDKTTFDQQ